MTNEAVKEYMVKNGLCSRVCDKHINSRHANMVLRLLNSGFTVTYLNTYLGDGIFQVLGYSVMNGSLIMHGFERGELEDAFDNDPVNIGNDDRIVTMSFDDAFSDDDGVNRDMRYVAFRTDTKTETIPVNLPIKMWETIASAVHAHCLTLGNESDNELLQVLKKTQEVLLGQVPLTIM